MLKYKVTVNQQNIAETGLEPGMEVTDMQECQVVNMQECEVIDMLIWLTWPKQDRCWRFAVGSAAYMRPATPAVMRGLG